MKKVQSPTFKAQQIKLAKCPACKGKAFIKGVFYDLACVQCNASGWVDAETGDALPLEVLVTQLSLRLQVAEQKPLLAPSFMTLGEARQYEQNNRRGPGATNYTGD